MGSLEPDLSRVTIVNNPLALQEKIEAIRRDSAAKLQVIADFDSTLTKYFVNGRNGQSSHGIIKQENLEYDAKREALYEFYHPLEMSTAIPIEEKTKLMEQWWLKTHSLLIEGGLTRDNIKDSVSSCQITFRDGLVELFELLEELEVPVLIFSAGLGDIIEEVLRQKLHRSFKNIEIVSNRMLFDDNGKLVSFRGKLIHSLNKNEHAIEMAVPLHGLLGEEDVPFIYSATMKNRTNVLLMGDNLGDLGMSDGLNYETRVAIGFLNDKVNDNLESYRNAFDVVYLDDAPMWGVLKLVSGIWTKS